MAKIQTIKNKDNTIIYPQTHTQAVYDAKNGGCRSGSHAACKSFGRHARMLSGFVNFSGIELHPQISPS